MHQQADPTDDEIAAALAAVGCYIAQHALGDPADRSEKVAQPRRPWSTAAALAAQGMPATRGGAYRGWGVVERAARAGRWSFGIIGL